MAAVRIDLHVHSNASDGTDAPAEVVRRARAAGLDVLALTDHDTQAGIAEAREALPPGLTLVPGMELSCQQEGRSIHLLAYLFDPQDPALAAETAQIRDDRTYRARAMVAKLRELGADVTWEQVSAIADGGVVGRPHLARALAAAGAVATPADAFTADWIADGGRAFVDRYAPGTARAIGLVLAAGGVPVLAHPRSPGYEVSDEAIAGLAGAGLRGIEVFHLDHDQSQRSRLAALAGSLDLIMTGGSDDHGTYLPGGRPPVPPAGLPGGRPPAANGNGLGAETTPPDQYERLLALASPAAASLSVLRAPVAGPGRARVGLECPLALEPFTSLSRPKFGRPEAGIRVHRGRIRRSGGAPVAEVRVVEARVERVGPPRAAEREAPADDGAPGAGPPEASEANAWLIGDDEEVIVIDPGEDAERVLEQVGEREILAVICTHGHAAHVAAAVEVAERDEAPVAVHRADRPLWHTVHGGDPEIEMADGGRFDVADVQLEVIHTAGHTPGSVSLYCADLDVVFTGDTLAASGPVPHEGQFADFATQLAAIGEHLLDLPLSTRVLPGHGEESTISDAAKRFDGWVSAGPAEELG